MWGAEVLRSRGNPVTRGTDVLLPFPVPDGSTGLGLCTGGGGRLLLTPIAAAPNSPVPGTTSENPRSLRHPESRPGPGQALGHQPCAPGSCCPPEPPGGPSALPAPGHFLPPGSGASRYQGHHRGIRPRDPAPSLSSLPARLGEAGAPLRDRSRPLRADRRESRAHWFYGQIHLITGADTAPKPS